MVRSAFFKVFLVSCGLLATAAVGQWLALFVFKISCEAYRSLPYKIFFVVTEGLGIVVTVLTIFQFIAWLRVRRFRQALLLAILFTVAVPLGLRLFAEMALYCLGEALVEMLKPAAGTIFEMFRTIVTPK